MQGVQPKAKAEPDQIGAEQACGPRLGVVARFAVQDRNVDDAQEMQADNDDEHAGDLGEQAEIFRQELAGKCRARAEHDEHGGEAEHEGDRGKHDGAVDVARGLVLAGELVEGGAAEEAEIRRHERKHARAEEAQDPCDHRAEIANVHAPSPAFLIDLPRHYKRASAPCGAIGMSR